jgi:hypothetical protein
MVRTSEGSGLDRLDGHLGDLSAPAAIHPLRTITRACIQDHSCCRLKNDRAERSIEKAGISL